MTPTRLAIVNPSGVPAAAFAWSLPDGSSRGVVLARLSFELLPMHAPRAARSEALPAELRDSIPSVSQLEAVADGRVRTQVVVLEAEDRAGPCRLVLGPLDKSASSSRSFAPLLGADTCLSGIGPSDQTLPDSLEGAITLRMENLASWASPFESTLPADRPVLLLTGAHGTERVRMRLHSVRVDVRARLAHVTFRAGLTWPSGTAPRLVLALDATEADVSAEQTLPMKPAASSEGTLPFAAKAQPPSTPKRSPRDLPFDGVGAPPAVPAAATGAAARRVDVQTVAVPMQPLAESALATGASEPAPVTRPAAPPAAVGRPASSPPPLAPTYLRGAAQGTARELAGASPKAAAPTVAPVAVSSAHEASDRAADAPHAGAFDRRSPSRKRRVVTTREPTPLVLLWASSDHTAQLHELRRKSGLPTRAHTEAYGSLDASDLSHRDAVLLEWLARAEPTSLPTVAATAAPGTANGPGTESSRWAVVDASFEPHLRPEEVLRSAIAACMAQPSPPSALAQALEHLHKLPLDSATPENVSRAALERLLSVVRSSSSELAREVESSALRAALRRRALTELEVLGGPHLVGVLSADRSSLAGYLAAEAIAHLPLERRFDARVVTELVARVDPEEPSPIALRVVAIARRTTRP